MKGKHCYHPRCPEGARAQRKCDKYRAAGCIWRIRDQGTAEFIQRLWAEREERKGREQRRCCPACREQTVMVKFGGRWMELCTACASLWHNRRLYDWRGKGVATK